MDSVNVSASQSSGLSNPLKNMSYETKEKLKKLGKVLIVVLIIVILYMLLIQPGAKRPRQQRVRSKLYNLY